MKNTIMKKIYQTPSVNVTFVHTTQMLATSFDKYDSGADTGVVLTKQNTNDWGDIWSK